MPWSYFFDFTGRVARLPYIGWTIAITVLTWVILATMGAMMSGVPEIVLVIMMLLAIPYGLCMASFTVRRLHDMGYAGWHIGWLFGLNMASNTINNGSFVDWGVLIAATAASIWVMAVPSQPGTNIYGPMPED